MMIILSGGPYKDKKRIFTIKWVWGVVFEDYMVESLKNIHLCPLKHK
jgi:hypothetical protein